MLYGKFKSVAANTTQASPDWEKCKVTKGEIVQWVIFFDPEAANLLHVKVEYHGVKILPYGELESITGFLEPIKIPESIKLDQEPYDLDITAWNDDDTNPHEYYIHPVIKPPTSIRPITDADEGIVSRFFNFFGGG